MTRIDVKKHDGYRGLDKSTRYRIKINVYQ